jgi:hypothetical protein
MIPALIIAMETKHFGNVPQIYINEQLVVRNVCLFVCLMVISATYN